ncbi:MAG: hypothetical protein ACRC33_25595 [Gemmataceae bacterium]
MSYRPGPLADCTFCWEEWIDASPPGTEPSYLVNRQWHDIAVHPTMARSFRRQRSHPCPQPAPLIQDTDAPSVSLFTSLGVPTTGVWTLILRLRVFSGTACTDCAHRERSIVYVQRLEWYNGLPVWPGISLQVNGPVPALAAGGACAGDEQSREPLQPYRP